MNAKTSAVPLAPHPRPISACPRVIRSPCSLSVTVTEPFTLARMVGAMAALWPYAALGAAARRRDLR